MEQRALQRTDPVGPDGTETAPAATVPVGADAAALRGEAAMLTREAARAHGSFVAFYEEHYKVSREEAVRRARESSLTPEDQLRRLEEDPPDQLTWYQFNDAMAADPDRALARWDRLKEQARDEYESGARGAEAARQESPWERARYAAIRQGFVDEWRPRGGLELTLIDQMAQAHTGWTAALRDYGLLASAEAERTEREVDARGRYRPPTEYRAALEDRALQTADRFQRVFLRTLRALRDLRRYAPHVTIDNRGGQVNIGERQVNVRE